MLGKNVCPTFSLICESCIENKKYWVIYFNDGGRQATKCLEIVHSDVCGSIKDVVIIKGSTFTGNNMEIRVSGRNNALIVVGVNESSKRSLFDLGKGIEEREE